VAVVEIRGLSKSYGRTLALDDVTVDVTEGVTGLLGPNGAGKSTLLLCALGLLPGWTGEVRVLGLDARRERRAVRGRVGFMPEARTWVPGLSAIRAVRFLARLSGMSRNEGLRRAHEVLFHVGLGEEVYRPVAEFSTGMLQRFKLAQALVHDPELLFLDEPLAGLDPEGRDELLRLVRDLAVTDGKHVVWSSHILPEVQRAADAVVVLHHGKSRGSVRLDASREQAGRFDVELEGDPAAFERRVAEAGATLQAPTGPSAVVAGVAGVPRHHLRATLGAGGTADDLIRWGREAGVRVRRVAPVTHSLEEVFEGLLGEDR
jgi:ABC-2 type transport system ATP-binding protein